MADETARSEEQSLEGWVPQLGQGLTLDRVVDLAFDYRGNTTVVKRDGTRLVGYLFNRNSDAKEPYVQLFDEQGDGPFKVLYAEIENIEFSGKDTATGKSYAAWLRRKEHEKADQEKVNGRRAEA